MKENGNRQDAYVDTHKDRFIEELKAFLRFPSVSAQRTRDADTMACAQWLRAHMAELGLDAKMVDQGGQPIIVARGAGASDRRVAVYGHYDVQPEDPLDLWHNDPFDPIVKDNVIYARGATDDKGQFFAHVKAVETLLQTENRLPCNVVFLIEGEEESGGEALARYVRSTGKDLNPDALVISDGDMHDANTPAINYGLRGIVTFEVTITGPDHDLHSGAYGGAVANPAVVLAQILGQCVSPEGRVTIPGFYDDVIPLEDWEVENIRKLRFDDQTLVRDTGSPRLHGEPGQGSLARLWARPTFEINGIYGGYQGQHTKTIIPSRAAAKLSTRLVPNQEYDPMRDRVFDYIRSICPDTVSLEITEFGGGPPVLIDTGTPELRIAMDALRHGFNAEPVFTRTGGSIPIITTFAQQWACPIILMGLGLDSDGPHSPNEHFSLDSFVKGIKASAHFLKTV